MVHIHDLWLFSHTSGHLLVSWTIGCFFVEEYLKHLNYQGKDNSIHWGLTIHQTHWTLTPTLYKVAPSVPVSDEENRLSHIPRVTRPVRRTNSQVWYKSRGSILFRYQLPPSSSVSLCPGLSVPFDSNHKHIGGIYRKNICRRVWRRGQGVM